MYQNEASNRRKRSHGSVEDSADLVKVDFIVHFSPFDEPRFTEIYWLERGFEDILANSDLTISSLTAQLTVIQSIVPISYRCSEEQIDNPVQWSKSIKSLGELSNNFVEIGPKKVLNNIIKN